MWINAGVVVCWPTHFTALVRQMSPMSVRCALTYLDVCRCSFKLVAAAVAAVAACGADRSHEAFVCVSRM